MMRKLLLLAAIVVIEQVSGQNNMLLDQMINSSVNIFAVRIDSVDQTGITWTLGTVNEVIEAKITQVYKGSVVDSSVCIYQRLICDAGDPSYTYRPVPVQAGKEYFVFLLTGQKGVNNNKARIIYNLKDNMLGILPRHDLLEKDIEALVRK